MVPLTHGNLIRTLTARWLGLPAAAGAHHAATSSSAPRQRQPGNLAPVLIKASPG